MQVARGVVLEYASNEDAERSIGELNDTSLMDRVVFVREDRETLGQNLNIGILVRSGSNRLCTA